VIAGAGAADVELAVRRAAEANPRITAELGFVSEERKHELYRACDLVVLPYTEFASQSGVLHDAYAHHRPVVVTDVGALGASVRDDGSGWVVPPSDAGALAGAIDAARADGRAWGQAATHAANVAADRTPEATAIRLRQVYLGAVRNRA
jgi:glycosyltransferase involved in cell wall biosynthesis